MSVKINRKWHRKSSLVQNLEGVEGVAEEGGAGKEEGKEGEEGEEGEGEDKTTGSDIDSLNMELNVCTQ